ncbi:phage integrase SAM-like domain-containing protein [Xylophilus ampelinus]|uniref:Site-specific recombinase XerD n=1 Tax=Xylophilus ampelinus TaxID=54067 RepID=A0A318SMB4_9BURK|nr:phage integrase SAM-like domain-containing protein [Xylophilus ampelinus]MCS4510378.1 site-specific integrase [Xylophilus ampelinus]PYE77999.1 site-specific recombinase XerD [Xylophilus ampelinus]
MTKPKLSDFDLSGPLSPYELDLERGIAKATDSDDHARMMEAMQALRTVPRAEARAEGVGSVVVAPARVAGLTLSELLDKFLLLRKLRPASVLAMRNTVKEFEKFLQKRLTVNELMPSDVTRYQEHLAEARGNTARTIDSKVGYLRSVLNHGVTQGYVHGKNPAEGRNLLTKRQKRDGGYGIFESDDIALLFKSESYKRERHRDPDFYYASLLGLITGCRIGEITSLTASQFKTTETGNRFIVIRDAKTQAGKREIPLPAVVFSQLGLGNYLKDRTEGVFKYASREGKGTGNAAGQKFSRLLKGLRITGHKLCFHSLRKFANDFYMKAGVEYEPRCQMLGHEIEAVNVATYSRKYNLDELAKLVHPAQLKLLKLAGLAEYKL